MSVQKTRHGCTMSDRGEKKNTDLYVDFRMSLKVRLQCRFKTDMRYPP